jgi:hypothetical protein
LLLAVSPIRISIRSVSVYDMYPWDSDSQGDYPPEPLRSWRHPNPRDTSPAQAVQTALDRRDNGGDAAASRAAAAASHNAAAHVTPHATPPTTSLTRQ